MRARVAAIAALVAAPILSVPVLGQSPSPSPVPAIPAGPVVQCPVIALAGDGTRPPASSPASTTPIPLASIAPAPDARSLRRWSGTWTPMPAAPIAPRTGAATDLAVWANRIYVWGGRGADGRLLADGAWYDVAAGTWEVLPDADLNPRPSGGWSSPPTQGALRARTAGSSTSAWLDGPSSPSQRWCCSVHPPPVALPSHRRRRAGCA